MADHEGDRFLVAMLGNGAKWVANVRAADGRAVLCHGRRDAVWLDEVDSRDRVPILRRHLQVAPAARSFVPVRPGSVIAEFNEVAPEFPVFRIRSVPA